MAPNLHHKGSVFSLASELQQLPLDEQMLHGRELVTAFRQLREEHARIIYGSPRDDDARVLELEDQMDELEADAAAVFGLTIEALDDWSSRPTAAEERV